MKTFKYKETITFDDKVLGMIQGQYLGDGTFITVSGATIEAIFVAIPREAALKAQEECGNKHNQFRSLTWHVDNKSERIKCRLVQLFSNVNEHFPEEKYLFRMFKPANIADTLTILVSELALEVK